MFATLTSAIRTGLEWLTWGFAMQQAATTESQSPSSTYCAVQAALPPSEVFDSYRFITPHRPLAEAICFEDQSAVVAQIKEDPTAVNRLTVLGGRSPAYLAVERCKPAALELVLKAGADPEFGISNGYGDRYGDVKPIHKAIRTQQADAIRELLTYGADVDAHCMYAALPTGNPDIFRQVSTAYQTQHGVNSLRIRYLRLIEIAPLIKASLTDKVSMISDMLDVIKDPSHVRVQNGFIDCLWMANDPKHARALSRPFYERGVDIEAAYFWPGQLSLHGKTASDLINRPKVLAVLQEYRNGTQSCPAPARP